MKSPKYTVACQALRRIAAAALLATAGAGLAQSAQAPASAPAAPARQAGIPAWSIPSADLPADPAIRFGTLPNGMRYALMHHEMPKGAAAMRFSIDAGVRNEREAELGAAHFVEHMAFNGSTNIPEGELVKRLERLGLAFGADTNAETGIDYTTYKLDLPHTTDEIVDAGLTIMRETAENLTIAPAAVEREKGVIQGESRLRNVPQRRRTADMLTLALPGSRIGDGITVEPDEVAATTPEMLREFYRRYYRPERATLVVVGDFDVAAMERKVVEQFSDWQGAGDAAADYDLEVQAAGGPAIGAFSDPTVPEIIELRRVRDYTPPTNSMAEERDKLLELIAAFVLGNRLNTLAQQPDTAVLGGQGAREDLFRTAESYGVFVVAKDGEWRRALAVAEQETRRAQEFGFTQAEVDEAKANLQTALANQVQQQAARQSADIAAQIVSASLQDSVVTSPETQLAGYQAIAPTLTPEAVHQAFRAVWREGPTAIHVSTKQPIPEAPQAIAAALSESAAVAVTAPVEQAATAFAYENFGPAGTVVSDKRIDDLGIRELTFANGLQLNLKKTDFEPGKIAFLMQVGEGLSAFPRDRQGLPLMANLVSTFDGLEKHGIDDLRRILAGRTVSRGLAPAAGAIMAQGGTTAADLELQLQLLAATLTAGGYRPETQTQWATAAPILSQNLSADAMQVLGQALQYTVAGNDARVGMVDLEALSGLTVADLKAVLDPQLKHGAIAIGLIGDFEEDAAVAAVARTLGALAPRGERAANPTQTVAFTADRSPRILRHAGAPDQGAISLSWPTTDDRDFRSTMVREMLAAVLQLRLTDTIREELGATYGGAAVSAASDAFAGYGHLTTVAPARPADMDTIVGAIKAITADLAATPASDDELLRARLPVLEQYDRLDRTNGGWAALVTRAQSDPERLERRRQRDDVLRAITPAEIQAAARQWFAGEPLEIRVLPKG